MLRYDFLIYILQSFNEELSFWASILTLTAVPSEKTFQVLERLINWCIIKGTDSSHEEASLSLLPAGDPELDHCQ
jgi:hypothetical protein